MHIIEQIDEKNGDITIRGVMPKKDFDMLPPRIKETIYKSESIVKYTDTEIILQFHSNEEEEAICSLVDKHERNKLYSKNKQWMLLTRSGGTYEDEDIYKIYEAQEGLCYYTRQPLTMNPRNFEIDHIIPVADNGSSFPGNLALAIKQVNRNKRNYTKGSFLSSLADTYGGSDWLIEQRKFCRRVDARRKKIDDHRKQTIVAYMKFMESELNTLFPGEAINYSLSTNYDIDLIVNATLVSFPPGFMRQKKLFNSIEYVSGIVKSLLAKNR